MSYKEIVIRRTKYVLVDAGTGMDRELTQLAARGLTYPAVD